MTSNNTEKSPYHKPVLSDHGKLVARTGTNPPTAGNTNEPGKVPPNAGDNPEKKTA